MSMIVINFSNIEELVFQDPQLQRKLPRLFNYFEQWKLGIRVPYLRDISKQAILDLLNGLTEDDQVIIEEHLKDRVVIEKLHYNVVLNLTIPIEENQICSKFCEIKGFNYYDISRDDEFLYVTFWR